MSKYTLNKRAEHAIAKAGGVQGMRKYILDRTNNMADVVDCWIDVLKNRDGLCSTKDQMAAGKLLADYAGYAPSQEINVTNTQPPTENPFRRLTTSQLEAIEQIVDAEIVDESN